MKRLIPLFLALFAAPLIASAGDKSAEIGHDELMTAIEEKSVTVIDVNGTDSYKEGHIPGAINFEAAEGDLAAKLPEDKDALIVAYCGGPSCGAYKAATKAATKLGYTNVKHYKGGISGWKESKSPVEKGDS